ncbi:MAG: GNAT family N-acetyltransferase, partial [Lysobacterales bacterium CG17_big_fil_post_rev_8_21_14_2_50_64_11]
MAVLDTPRLRLRPIVPGDAAFLLGLLNEPAFLRQIGDRGVRNHAD